MKAQYPTISIMSSEKGFFNNSWNSFAVADPETFLKRLKRETEKSFDRAFLKIKPASRMPMNQR